MKLDKIKFAEVVKFIVEMQPQNHLDIVELDNLIDIDVEPVSTELVDVEKVNELLRCMQERLTGGFISAIKAYRALTGVGLKESKDAIEKYSQ